MTDNGARKGRVLIFGAGGHAREVGCLARDVLGSNNAVAAYVVADDNVNLGKSLHGSPIRAASEAAREFPDVPFIVAIGDPIVRRRAAEQAAVVGLRPGNLVHPSVIISEYVELGLGSIICAGCILTCDIKIGAHVHLNRACMVSHDVVIGDYATLNPGVRVSGNVCIGPSALLGVGATIIDGRPDHPIVIHEGAVVGAQACVLSDVAAFEVVVGVPAKPVRRCC